MTLRSLSHQGLYWAAMVTLAIAVLIGAAIAGRLGAGTSRYFFMEFRTEGRLSGLMTVASAFFLGAGGVQLFSASALMKRTAAAKSVFLAGLVGGVVLVILGLDELLMLHERFPSPIPGLGGEKGFYAAYGVVAMGTAWYAAPALRTHWRALAPLVIAIVFLGLTQAVDMLIPWEPLTAAQRDVVGPLEEITKTVGAFMLFMFATTLLISIARSDEVGSPRAGDDLPS